MSKHADDDQVMFGYSASSNCTFRSEKGGEELGYTWGEWRQMGKEKREMVMRETRGQLLETWIEEDEGDDE